MSSLERMHCMRCRDRHLTDSDRSEKIWSGHMVSESKFFGIADSDELEASPSTSFKNLDGHDCPNLYELVLKI